MGSARKQAERSPVFPIGDAIRIENTGVSSDPPLLAAAMEACPENLAIVENGCFLYANRAFAQTFGYSADANLKGIPLAQIIPASQLLAPSGLPNGKVAGFPPSEFNPGLVAVRKDGTGIRVRLAGSCFEANDGNFMVLVLRDCQTEEDGSPVSPQSLQLESLGRIAGAVAHDFNNLLTGILLYCDLLLSGLADHDPLRTYVAEIRRAGGHSAELVQQLMAAARPQAEAGAHTWQGVISGMRNLLLRLVGENIELDMDLGASKESISMDAGPMRQIVLNLLLNARDAMPYGGQIRLAAQPCNQCYTGAGSEGNSCVVLQVTDTGSGMDASTRAHLFQTFFTTKGVGKGTGLGLCTVDRLVRQHGGTIQVESEPAKGTRVSVHLPCAQTRIAVTQFHHKQKPNTR